MADSASEEYASFLKDVVLRRNEQFVEFDRYENRLDTFFHDLFCSMGT